jgi:transglutaminase-like putative cysteine protease
VIGFASLDRAGMSRAVPALGLPVATLVYRSGETTSALLVLAWVVAVVATLVLGNRVTPIERGLEADGPGGGLVLGRRRALQTVVAAAVVAPAALLVAGAIGRAVPELVAAGSRGGAPAGAAAQTHPGLTGGLDAGSPVVLTDDVVLRVRADRPLYWRGTTYDEWDGRRWSRGDEPQWVSWSGAEVDLDALRASVAPAGDATAAPADPVLADPVPADPVPAGRPRLEPALPEPVVVRQEFEAEQAGFDVVIGAWRMISLATTARQAVIGADGSVILPAPLEPGATWTVESVLVPVGEEELRQADPASLPPSSAAIQRYAVEDAVTAPVAELARSITASSPTTYDKVRAIEAWMDANVTYTRDLLELPIGSDAVHHLLFESRRGFCEQIGSALVVMLRSLGIPARLAVGYVPGEYDGDSGQWLSRGTDAHAWAEVYFPAIGWQGFDPTAGVPLAADVPTEPLPVDTSLLVAIAVALVAVVALVAAGRVRQSRRLLAVPGGDRALAELQRRFDACGAKLGRRWPASMTAREKGEDLVAGGAPPGPVARVVAALERLAFFDLDRIPPTGVDLSPLDAELDRLERDVDSGSSAVAGARGTSEPPDQPAGRVVSTLDT